MRNETYAIILSHYNGTENMKLVLRSRAFFWTALIAITLLGFGLRIYDIDRIPFGLYPDEAMNGVDALTANETGNYRLFYPDNYGREGLFINIQALSIRAFGPTMPALKFPSIVFGTLAVLGIGLLAWELFQSRYAALIAAFLTATSYWAINFSRIGFRAIMVPFLFSFSFFLFFRGLRTRKFLPFFLSGLFFGTGLHTYVAFRLAPLILVLLLPFLALSYESFFRRFWKHALVFILGAGLAAAPMFYLFATEPDVFSSRSAAVSIFSPEVNGGNFWGTLGRTVGLSLIKYNFVGDMNWRHNYPPYPVLDPVSGIAFLGGFLFSIVFLLRLLRKRFRENRPDTELVAHAFLLIAFLVMLMPEFLTNEGLPHALRSIGTQPSVFLFSTIPLLFLFRKANRSQSGMKVGLILFICIVLGVSAVWNTSKYFVFFANNPAQYASFNAEYRNVADWFATLPDDTNKYVVPESFVAEQPIIYLTEGRASHVMFIEPDTRIMTPAVIVQQRYRDTLIGNVRNVFPTAYETRIDPLPGTGTAFTAIVIPGNDGRNHE